MFVFVFTSCLFQFFIEHQTHLIFKRRKSLPIIVCWISCPRIFFAVIFTYNSSSLLETICTINDFTISLDGPAKRSFPRLPTDIESSFRTTVISNNVRVQQLVICVIINDVRTHSRAIHASKVSYIWWLLHSFHNTKSFSPGVVRIEQIFRSIADWRCIWYEAVKSNFSLVSSSFICNSYTLTPYPWAWIFPNRKMICKSMRFKNWNFILLFFYTTCNDRIAAKCIFAVYSSTLFEIVNGTRKALSFYSNFWAIIRTDFFICVHL